MGVALSVLALGVAAGLPSGAPGYHHGAGEARWLEAVAKPRPLDGSAARGLVQISSHRDGPTRIRGIVKGLLIPAVQMVRIAVGDLSCDELGSGEDTSDLTLVGDWRPAGENGTA